MLVQNCLHFFQLFLATISKSADISFLTIGLATGICFLLGLNTDLATFFTGASIFKGIVGSYMNLKK